MIHVDGSDFKDEFGRTLLLRGVNLGGSSKVPTRPNGATYLREGFFDHRDVSFVGRPFPLEEADEHFRRLRAWGLTFLRFLVTWEAIEHAGPGIYDEEYLDYVRAIVIKAGEYGFDMFIDPHQDVWSRFSGGDGAPGWTLEAAGFDMTQFHETGAAIVHATHGDPFPRMIWPSNGGKLAAATMFTLFFGGNDFAPRTTVAGEPVQEFLQRHYIAAICKVADRLKDLPNVVGYDTINEPLAGYIGWKDLNKPGGPMTLGASPSPMQSFALGEGIPQEVARYQMGVISIDRKGTHRLNDARQRAWKDGCGCIWHDNGVWDLDSSGQPRLLRPDYFTQVDGRQVVFDQDYYYPFALRFSKAIRTVDPRAVIFIESEPNAWPPHWAPENRGNLVYAPHWYDAIVLVSKKYSPYLGIDVSSMKPVFLPGNIRKSFARQLAFLKQGAQERLGGTPVLLGEFGIPFDMENKLGFHRGDFRKHEAALDRTFQALDANLLHGTLWDYTSDNNNAHGDLWNDEDLSLFSRSQQSNPQDIHSGGRALRAAVRPYARAAAGEPLRMAYEMDKREFTFTFRHDAGVIMPTEIFVPEFVYPQGCRVEISDGRYEMRASEQTLVYWHDPTNAEHTIRIHP